MYLADLDGIGLVHSDGWEARVTVKVIDADGNPVSGAKVVGDWKKHSGQMECVTDGSGQCALLSDPVTKKHATFVVNRIQHEYLSFHTRTRLNNEGNPAERTIKVLGPKGNPNADQNDEETPEPEATDKPVEAPVIVPTPDPVGTPEPEPTDEPPAEATEEATAAPTEEATEEPTPEPTAEATEASTSEPAAEPSQEPPPEPNEEATPDPSQEPSPEPVAMHVADLAGTSLPDGNKWRATMTITIVEANLAPVSGANVSLTLSGDNAGPATCVTDDNGQCSVTSDKIKSDQASITFTVDDVSHPTYTYQTADNTDPDGDSDGTILTVNNPM
jgi:hypothetical protein